MEIQTMMIGLWFDDIRDSLSMNVVGVANMRAIIQKNGWREVF